MVSVLCFLCFLGMVVERLVETGPRHERSFVEHAEPQEMAGEEHKPTIGSDLLEQITYFNWEKLRQSKTKENMPLPNQAAIEQAKKAAQEEASGK